MATTWREEVSGDHSYVPVWMPPQLEQITAALDYFRTRRPEKVHLTIVLKLRTRSRRKEQALLQAQKYATNMTAKVLEALREDPKQFRTDGAFACILEVLHRYAEEKRSGNDCQVAL